MNFKTFTCPNCAANYNPAKYQCEYCGSYIFMSNDNYTDFSNVKIELPQCFWPTSRSKRKTYYSWCSKLLYGVSCSWWQIALDQ